MASFLKKVGKGLKKVGKVAGKGLQIAAPLLAATGVGAPLAIAAGVAGGAMQGGKPKEWLKRAAIGGGTAALGAGVGKLAGAATTSKLGGIAKNVGQKVGGAVLNKATGGASGAMGVGAPGGGGGGWGGALNTLADLAPVALGAYGAYQGAQDARRSRGIEDRMLAQQEAEYAAGAPLRTRARSMAMQGPPTLGAMVGQDMQNPFARRVA